MKSIHKSLAFVAALLLAALALPVNAATKQYNATLSPLAGGNSTFTLNNLSSGNSVIKSWTLSAPTGYSITSAVPVAPYTGTVSTTCSPQYPCAYIQVNYASGIPPQTAAQVTLGITAPAASACSQSAPWGTGAFTGNNIGGQPFNDQGPPTTLASVTGCQLQFLTQPANAQINTAITSSGGGAIQVGVTDGTTTQTWFTGGITLTNAGPGTGTLTGGGSVNAVNGVATFSSLKLDAAGLYALTASSSGFTSVNSNQFTVFSGILACGDSLASTFTNPNNIAPDQPGYAAGNRGTYNKDGSTCIKVPYTFTNTILQNDTVYLSWDMTVQASPAFMYSMNWRPRNVEPATTGNPATTNPLAGWTLAPRPVVAWLNTDGSSTNVPGTPQFIPGLACVSGKLPAPYGALGGDIDNQVTKVTITGVKANPASAYTVPMPGAPAVPDVPFPIVIPNTTSGVERMTAVSIDSQSPATAPNYTGTYTITYNVTRGTATEGFSTPAAHTQGQTVMSTPLPIIPNDATTFPAPYTVQRQAPTCVAEHGFDSFRIGPDGTTQVMYFTTVIDVGDALWGVR